ncbi:MAG: exo-alpha-sialidase [Acidobacteria bacterium]|nr:exo-alpha-sialidase [Acidobacteriota bacterium]
MARRTIAPLLLLAALIAGSLARAADAPTFSAPTRLPGAGPDTEPRLAVGPDGTRWVISSTSSGLAVVYHYDATTGTWARTKTDPIRQTGPTIDVDIAVTRTGRVLATELDLAAVQTRVYYSDDRGDTWNLSPTAGPADQDRQWLAVGPDDLTTGLPRVYLLYHNLVTGEASHNMWVATSIDNGATFLPPVPITLPGTEAWLDLQCADSGGPDGMLVDPVTGRLTVSWGTRSSLIGGCGASVTGSAQFNIVFATRIWAAISPDASPGSWTTSLAVDQSASGRMAQMQGASPATDTDGNVYIVFDRSPHPFPDFTGASVEYTWAPPDLSAWAPPTVIEPDDPNGGPGNTHAHARAGAPGKLDVVWYKGVTSGTKTYWYTTVAQVTDALGTSPMIYEAPPLADFAAYEGTAAANLGHCGTTAASGIEDGLLCDRITDVWGVALDAGCEFLIAWPGAANPSSSTNEGGTWITVQTGGPTVCP